MSEMDAAADRALNELPEDLSEWSAEDLARWIKEHYREAGYKRLCRPLLRRIAA